MIRQINRTNAATVVQGGTLTDALARRDELRLRHNVVTAAADAEVDLLIQRTNCEVDLLD